MSEFVQVTLFGVVYLSVGFALAVLTTLWDEDMQVESSATNLRWGITGMWPILAGVYCILIFSEWLSKCSCWKFLCDPAGHVAKWILSKRKGS